MIDKDTGRMPDYLRTLADEVYEARSGCIRLCREVDSILGITDSEDGYGARHYQLTDKIRRIRADAACLLAKAYLRQCGTDLEKRDKSLAAREEDLAHAKELFRAAMVRAMQVIVIDRKAQLEGQKAQYKEDIALKDQEDIFYPLGFKNCLDKASILFQEVCEDEKIDDSSFKHCDEVYQEFCSEYKAHADKLAEKVQLYRSQTRKEEQAQETINIRRRNLKYVGLGIITTLLATCLTLGWQLWKEREKNLNIEMESLYDLKGDKKSLKMRE